MGEYLNVHKLSAYKKSFKLSQLVWNLIISWEYFAKDTIGKQLVRAVDSVSANIAEGFGRYHKKEKIHFYYISKASALESLDWIEKAYLRNLIDEINYQQIKTTREYLPKELNNLIAFTNEKLKY